MTGESWVPAATLLALVMFSIGLSLPSGVALIPDRTQRRLLWQASLLQWLGLPLLALMWIVLIKPSSSVALALWLVAATPGGYSLLTFALLGRTDLAFATQLSLVSTVSKLLLTPLLWLAGTGSGLIVAQTQTPNPWLLARELAWVLPALLLPLALGTTLAHKLAPSPLAALQRLTQAITAICLLVALTQAAGHLAWPGSAALAPVAGIVIAHHASACLLGHLLGRALHLPQTTRRSLTLAAGTFNAGLAAPLALVVFPQDGLALLTLAFWMFWRLLVGASLSLCWRCPLPWRNAVAVTTTAEVRP
jgi:bile acid:Na+ symporter, BASS family